MKAFKGILLVIAMVMMMTTASFAGDKIKIALVIPSTIDDLAWSQAMYEGIKGAQAEVGADKLSFEVSERLWNAVDAGAAIRQYAMKALILLSLTVLNTSRF